jgi:hypothetical protein
MNCMDRIPEEPFRGVCLSPVVRISICSLRAFIPVGPLIVFIHSPIFGLHFYHEDGGNTFLRNVDKRLSLYDLILQKTGILTLKFILFDV